ncbi:MAG: ArdC family protein [Thermodesulfobacteriota bacterium]
MSDYIFKHVTDKILAQLEKGNVVWKKPWTSNGLPRNLISKRPYSGINWLLLAMAGFASPFWATKEAVGKLGGRVRPGELPEFVFFWKIQNLERPEGEEGDQSHQSRISIFYKAYQLYNVEQCEGIEKRVPPFVHHDFDPIDKCEKIVKDMPACPKISYGVPDPYYTSLMDEVKMPSRKLFSDTGEFYSALFHEIVHSTGHERRLGRHGRMREKFDSHEHRYSHEELVAEIGSGFLCAHAGIENHVLENSGAYIQHWIKRFENRQRMFFFAAAQAQSAVNYILGLGKTGYPQITQMDTDEKQEGQHILPPAGK